eukprot:950916-Amphidinium_carterae.1
MLCSLILTPWRSKGVRQVIYLAEVFPNLIAAYTLAKKVWAQRLAHRDVILLVENEAARITA